MVAASRGLTAPVSGQARRQRVATANIPTLLSDNVAVRTVVITTATYDDVCSTSPTGRELN
jgi:hypothetical protein